MAKHCPIITRTVICMKLLKSHTRKACSNLKEMLPRTSAFIISTCTHYSYSNWISILPIQIAANTARGTFALANLSNYCNLY
jgi:hypothetical protein